MFTFEDAKEILKPIQSRGAIMDTKLIEGAVKVRIAWERSLAKTRELEAALMRMRAKMSPEESKQYQERVKL